MQQTFFVGIGAQKAGTTWLYQFIHSHPDCRLSSMKEMHYFGGNRKRPFNSAHKRIEKHRKRALSLDPRQILYWTGIKRYHGYTMRQHLALLDSYEALLSDEKINAAAYVALLREYADGAQVFGEVTPAYAKLSKRELAEVYSASPKTRMIFLMRDPVSRLWSNARMRSNNPRKEYSAGPEAAMEEMINGKCQGVNLRSDYRGTLQRLAEAVPKEHVYCEFSENLFLNNKEGSSAKYKLCDFLEIERFAPASTRKIRNAGMPSSLPLELGRKAMEWLRPQYEYVGHEFGELPLAWQESLDRYG